MPAPVASTLTVRVPRPSSTVACTITDSPRFISSDLPGAGYAILLVGACAKREGFEWPHDGTSSVQNGSVHLLGDLFFRARHTMWQIGYWSFVEAYQFVRLKGNNTSTLRSSGHVPADIHGPRQLTVLVGYVGTRAHLWEFHGPLGGVAFAG